MCKKLRQAVHIDTAAVRGITSFSVDHVYIPTWAFRQKVLDIFQRRTEPLLLSNHFIWNAFHFSTKSVNLAVSLCTIRLNIQKF